jgi:hypothetical protein
VCTRSSDPPYGPMYGPVQNRMLRRRDSYSEAPYKQNSGRQRADITKAWPTTQTLLQSATSSIQKKQTHGPLIPPKADILTSSYGLIEASYPPGRFRTKAGDVKTPRLRTARSETLRRRPEARSEQERSHPRSGLRQGGLCGQRSRIKRSSVDS